MVHESTQNSSQGMMCNKSHELTVTEKTEKIQENIVEITHMVSEISSRIFGSQIPKITNDCCNMPVESSIHNTINEIGVCTDDLRHMLSDILKSL